MPYSSGKDAGTPWQAGSFSPSKGSRCHSGDPFLLVLGAGGVSVALPLYPPTAQTRRGMVPGGAAFAADVAALSRSSFGQSEVSRSIPITAAPECAQASINLMTSSRDNG